MLRCFRAVVENGRLSDAADVLGRTSSAVSMMLGQFEEHIGAPLFETTRKARLTPLGEQIYHEARRELDHFERTLANIEGLSRAQLGHIRLAVTPSVAIAILPPILKRFMADHPKIRIEIQDMNSAAVQRELEGERADIGLASIEPAAGLEHYKLFSDPFGVVCRSDHPLAKDWQSLTWADLAGEDFIANGLCDQIGDPGFRSVLDRSRLAVPNTTSLLGFVRAGIGITLLPRLAVSSESDDLSFLPLLDTSVQRDVWLVTQPKKMLTPAARAIVQAILISGDLKVQSF